MNDVVIVIVTATTTNQIQILFLSFLHLNIRGLNACNVTGMHANSTQRERERERKSKREQNEMEQKMDFRRINSVVLCERRKYSKICILLYCYSIRIKRYVFECIGSILDQWMGESADFHPPIHPQKE